MLARPASLASILAPLSMGKYPVCHWGVLFSSHSNVDLKHTWANRTLNSQEKSWGTLIELHRTAEDLNVPRVVSEFDRKTKSAEWSLSSIKYIGQTALTDRELFEHGIIIFKSKLIVSNRDHQETSRL